MADWRRRDNEIIWKSLLQADLIKRTLKFFMLFFFYLSCVSIQSLSHFCTNPAEFIIRWMLCNSIKDKSAPDKPPKVCSN